MLFLGRRTSPFIQSSLFESQRQDLFFPTPNIQSHCLLSQKGNTPTPSSNLRAVHPLRTRNSPLEASSDAPIVLRHVTSFRLAVPPPPVFTMILLLSPCPLEQRGTSTRPELRSALSRRLGAPLCPSSPDSPGWNQTSAAGGAERSACRHRARDRQTDSAAPERLTPGP